MPNPVVHFEVIGKDAPALQQYFTDLFGWSVDANNPMNYGLTDPAGALQGGPGIAGGIGPAMQGSDGHVTFYVGVPDVGASLARAVELGGESVFGPETIPSGQTLGQFRTPEGHLIGLLEMSEAEQAGA